MPTCSFCNASLEAIDIETGLCPVCGKPLTLRDTVEFDDPTADAAAADDSPSDPEENLATVEADASDFQAETHQNPSATQPPSDAAGDGSDTVDLSSDDFQPESPDSLRTLPMDDDALVDETQTLPLPVDAEVAVPADGDEQESLATVPMDEADALALEAEAGDTVEVDADDDVPVESFVGDDEQDSLGTVQMEDDETPASDDTQATMPLPSADESHAKDVETDGSNVDDPDGDDAIATLDIDAIDAKGDALATLPLDGDADDDDGGLDSGDEALATMVVEIPRGEREGLVDEQFGRESSVTNSAGDSSADGTPIDSIDESEQLATMPMDPVPGEADETAGGDSIDAAESAATHVMDADGEAIDDLVAKTFGEREGSGDHSTQQTIVSDDLADNDRHEQTLVTNDLPDEVLKTMKAAWVSADQPDITPGMTVKAEDLEALKTAAQAAPETSLVIKLRRLVAADETGTAEAEYELIKVLGEGGMGVVYLARQTSIDRSVAIKMLKPKTAKDTEQRLKFLAEAVVTGDLNHPNIVPIYDVGSNDSGALFYSMKKVEGTPWLDVIKKKTLGENLAILDDVANAVSFAHARGVVHRDLKPENVMLGGYGEVLLMDWGLAQPTKDFSKSGSIAETRSMGGTPAYMAPEMATGPLHKIGPHSDIYLLGAILFEIVTGKPPHRGANAMKCLMSAAKNEIRPVDETGELVDIAMRAMATNVEERHATVKDLQDAIKEYLSHSESIDLSDRADKELKEAEESDVYQDYARSLFGFQEAYALWNGNDRASEGISESRFAYAQSAMRKGDFDLGASLLDVDNPDQAALHTELVKGKKEVESRVRKLKLAKRAGFVGAAVFLIGVGVAFYLVDQQRQAAVVAQKQSNKDKIAAQTAKTQSDKDKIAAQTAKTQADKDKLAAQAAKTQSDKDKIVAVAAQEDAQQQTAIAQYRGYISTIGLAKAKIDENAFDAARDLLTQYIPKQGELDLRNWEWGRLMYLCSQDERQFDASGNVLDIDVSRDGTRLVTALEGGVIEVWDLVNATADGNTPSLKFSVGGKGVNVNTVVFSPDSTQIAVGTSATRNNVTLWNISKNDPPAMPAKTFGGSSATNRFAVEHTAAVLSIHFSEDGSQLVTGSEDNTARVWDVETGKQLAVLRGHNWWVWDAAFSPAGTQIVTAGQDGIAIVWTYDTKGKETRWSVAANIQQGPPFTGHTGPVYAAAFSPDGKDVVSGGYDRNVLIWKPEEVQPYRWENLQALRTTVGQLSAEQRVAPSAKARRLEGHIASVRAVLFFRKGSAIGSAAGPVAAGAANAAADDLLVLSSGDDGTVKVWNVATGTAMKTFRGHGSWVRTCAFAPDGQSVLSGSGDGTARQWSIADYAEIRELTGREFSGHGNAVLSAAFSRNNRNIVTASQDRTAKTWSNDGRELQTFREGHEYLTSNALFFPDGERLLTAAVDNTVRIWNVARGTEMSRLEHIGRSATVALSPDGRWILTGSDRSADAKSTLWAAKLWNAETGKLVLEITSDDPKDRTHTAEVTAVAFSSDGRTFFTGDGKGHGHLWRMDLTAEGKPSVTNTYHLKGHTWGQRIVAAQFLPDGKRVLTASTDKTVAQWDVTTGSELKSLLLKHDDSLTAMDVATDGTRTLVLTSCADLTVRLWNADTAEEVGRLTASGGVAALSRNVNDRLKQLNLEPQDVWSTSNLTKEDVSRILNPNSLRKPANFDDTLKTLARVLETRPADLLKPYIPSVAMSADGRRALTANSEDRIVRLWNLSTLKEIPIADGPYRNQSFLDSRRVASVEAAVFSPKEKMAKTDQFILTVGGSNAQLWDAATGREQIRYSPHGSVSAASYSPDGRFIVTAGLDSTARIWNTTSGKTVVILTGHDLDVNSAVFSPNGKTVLTASRDRTARLWDADTGNVLKTLQGHAGPVVQAVFSDDGRRVATASDDGTARIWSVADGMELARMDCRSGAVRCVAFSSDGRRVITGTHGQDSQSGAYAKIWAIEDKPNGTLETRELLYLTGHTAAVTSVAFSPDDEGSRALTGSEDYIVKLWDMRTTEDIAHLAAESQPVEAPVPGNPLQQGDEAPEDILPAVAEQVAEPAGPAAAPEAAKEILSLAGHQREVTSVAFSHDGQDVLTGSRDGKAILWLTIDWSGGNIARAIRGNSRRTVAASR